MSTYSVTGVGSRVSLTYYPMPPVEWGRSGGTVTAIEEVSAGTTYSTDTEVATTSDSNGTGLTVDTTASSGPVTAIAVNAGGDGYRLGELITVSGGTADATYKVTGLSYTN